MPDFLQKMGTSDFIEDARVRGRVVGLRETVFIMTEIRKCYYVIISYDSDPLLSWPTARNEGGESCVRLPERGAAARA